LKYRVWGKNHVIWWVTGLYISPNGKIDKGMGFGDYDVELSISIAQGKDGQDLYEGDIVELPRVERRFADEIDQLRQIDKEEYVGQNDFRKQYNLEHSDYSIVHEAIRGLVVLKNGGFQVEQITKGRHYEFSHIINKEIESGWDSKFYGYDGPEFNWLQLVVVGNKWENPDLLKGDYDPNEH
jgi:hypothetical protein